MSVSFAVEELLAKKNNHLPGVLQYRGTSPMRKRHPLGPYRRPMPTVQGESKRGGRFLMGKVPSKDYA